MKRALLALMVLASIHGSATAAEKSDDDDDVFSGPVKDMIQGFGEGIQRKLALQKKLRSVIISDIDLKDVPVSQAIDVIRGFAKDSDPQKVGFNVVYSPRLSATQKAVKVTIALKEIPVSEALRYTLSMAGLAYQIDEYALVIYDPSTGSPGSTAKEAPPQAPAAAPAQTH